MTRDDIKLTVGMIVAVVVGLVSLGDAATTYGIPAAGLPYLRLAALVLGIVSGKLATSPLPGDNSKIDTSRFLIWLLPLVLLGGLTVTGCANPRHVAVTVDVGLYHVLSDAHQLEQTALCGQPSCAGVLTAPTVPGWTDAKSRAFNQTLLPAVDAGRQFNALLASWKPGDPMPAQIQTLIAGLATSLLAITADFPDGTTKTQILADIGTAQATILNAFRLYLTVKG